MVLLMARREAGPHDRWQKINNSRKPRALTKNRHRDSLKRVNFLFLRVW
jgi:hypothetical protein